MKKTFLAYMMLACFVLTLVRIQLVSSEVGLLSFDINMDRVVDMRDITMISKIAPSSPDDPEWDPKIDVNSDGYIDILDVALVVNSFGTILNNQPSGLGNLTWLWIGGYGDKYGNRIRLADAVTGEPTEFAHKLANCGIDVISAPVFTAVYESWRDTAPNLTPQVVDLFHSKGIIVEYALAGTGTGERWNGKNGGWEATKREIDEAFKVCPNLDAIHDGEVDAITNEDSFDRAFTFFKKYYNYVKNTYGKRVIFNTGTANTPEIIMTICDGLSVEFNGERFMQTRSWARKPQYKDRFYCRPISYRWRGTIQEAIGDMEYHWDLGHKCVGGTYNAFWPRSGSSVHPFPRIYDWWDQLFKHFED